MAVLRGYLQDITDTHTARILVKVRSVFTTRLKGIAEVLCDLANRYRDTPMCGRTHGQPGLPITFGFKSAGWLDEIQRHCQRMDDLGTRLDVGQLAGGVGSLSSLGTRGLALQQRFFDRLELSTPAISWTASRDRLAEWINTAGTHHRDGGSNRT
ncbi:MAG: lyase family protein [Candidatus Methylumidiphilus sp.]